VQRIEILPTVDPRSHTATARLYLPDNVEGVVPGAYARAHFTVGQAKKLTVPPAAVLRRGEVTAVYVIDDKGAARLRQVRLGEAVAGGELEVLAGLNSGERVSLSPSKDRHRSQGGARRCPLSRGRPWARVWVSLAASPEYFLRNSLTPLIALIALLLGIGATLVTPREEEPQINVTMANVFVPFPGASARDVEAWWRGRPSRCCRASPASSTCIRCRAPAWR
jgi:hypothetical protein